MTPSIAKRIVPPLVLSVQARWLGVVSPASNVERSFLPLQTTAYQNCSGSTGSMVPARPIGCAIVAPITGLRTMMERVRVPAEMSLQKYVSLESHVLLHLRQCCGSSVKLASCRGLHIPLALTIGVACLTRIYPVDVSGILSGLLECLKDRYLPFISGCEALGTRRRLCHDKVGSSSYRSDHCRRSSLRVGFIVEQENIE